MLPRLVNIRFQSLFTPLAGVLFTFPSRYWFTIGHQVVLSLGRWSSRIPTGFLVSRCTQVPLTVRIDFAYGAVTLSGRPSQAARLPIHDPSPGLPSWPNGPTTRALQRRQACTELVWADPRSLATTGGVSVLISFPEGTEMFQFPSLAALRLCIQRRLDRLSSVAVSRFGDRRVDACLRLTVAYRSFATSFIASWCQGIHRMLLLA